MPLKIRNKSCEKINLQLFYWVHPRSYDSKKFLFKGGNIVYFSKYNKFVSDAHSLSLLLILRDSLSTFYVLHSQCQCHDRRTTVVQWPLQPL